MVEEVNVAYVTPKIDVMEVYSEGVICGSNEYVDENFGEW